MFCKYCGQQLNDGAAVCTHCGCPTENFRKSPERPAEKAAHKTNGFAIAGFVLALVSLVFGTSSALMGIVVPVVAIVLSAIGMAKSKTVQSGRGMAVAGLVIAIIALVLGIALKIVLAHLGLNLAAYALSLIFAATM